jgi:hypothetical protein
MGSGASAAKGAASPPQTPTSARGKGGSRGKGKGKGGGKGRRQSSASSTAGSVRSDDVPDDDEDGKDDEVAPALDPAEVLTMVAPVADAFTQPFAHTQVERVRGVSKLEVQRATAIAQELSSTYGVSRYCVRAGARGHA